MAPKVQGASIVSGPMSIPLPPLESATAGVGNLHALPDYPNAIPDRHLIMATVGKLVLCLGFRLPYVFLTPISKQLGTTIGHLGALMALGELAGLLTGVIGRSLDRGNFRLWLTAGSASTIAGVATMGTAATARVHEPILFALGFAMTSVGVAWYTTAAHAWLGASVPYAQRGQSMGRLETSWALAVLIGAPIFGLVISVFNVTTMFAGLTVVSTLNTFCVWSVFGRPASPVASPANGSTSSFDSAGGSSNDSRSVSSGVSSGTPEARALAKRIAAALVCSFVMSFGAICIFSVYGSWLTKNFGLSTKAVGFFSVFVGIAELGASTMSSTKTDRWGKRRSVAGGCVVMFAGMVAIGFVPKVPILGVGVLVLMFVGFEFGYVSLLSVISEVGEHRKGTVLSFDHALSPISRAAAAAFATNLFDKHGVRPVTVAAGLAAIVAFTAIQLATPTVTPSSHFATT